MSEVALSIDNRQVTVEEGTSVFEAARKAGIHIPTLLPWRPHAVCRLRLCVVEVEGARSLVASALSVR